MKVVDFCIRMFVFRSTQYLSNNKVPKSSLSGFHGYITDLDQIWQGDKFGFWRKTYF